MAETKLNSSVPNLFDYATSELSQDAFLLWLLNWANPKYKDADEQLNAAAQEFVRFLLDKNKNDLQIESVKCYKQLKNIDVLAIVNNVFAILIEDKTDTSEHDNQLTNYTQWFINEGKKILNIENEPELHCIYYKTGNESYYYLNKLEKEYKKDHQNVAFKILLRSDILNVLKEVVPSSLNPIFIDYVNHLQKIENQTQSYTKKSVSEWGSRAWQGFYLALEKCLNEKLNKDIEVEDNWKLCKWINDPYKDAWDFKLPKFSIKEDGSIKLYLQIDSQNGRLSLMAYCNSTSYPQCIDDVSEKKINSKLSEYDLKLEACGGKKAKRKKAKNMTLASIKKVNGKSFISKNKPIDFEYVAEKLKQLQDFLPDLAEYIKF